MIELFALVIALTGIVRMARTRGASPWVYGLTAGIGWFGSRRASHSGYGSASWP